MGIIGILILRRFIIILNKIAHLHFLIGIQFMDYIQEDQCLYSQNIQDMFIYQLILFQCKKFVLNFMDGIKVFHLFKAMKTLKVLNIKNKNLDHWIYEAD